VTLSVEAVYENGVLKPKEPLPLKEHEHVTVTIQQASPAQVQSYGIMGWTGTHGELEQILAEAEELEDRP
jgi:predicted DNA-binding antitoxin AbrB/MazE fold protein